MSEEVLLSANQKRALAALLSNRTVRAAAQACKLSEKTLYRYLGEDPFLRELRTAQAGLFEEVYTRLAVGQQAALDELERLITDARSEAVRRAAISDYLSLAAKLREMQDHEARITALEEAINT